MQPGQAGYHRAVPDGGRRRKCNSDEIRALVADDLRRVDAVIVARLASDVALVNQVAQLHHRRRRQAPAPAARCCSRPAPAATRAIRHVEAAAFIEFIHTATLLHDDVVDGSDLRRGRETANHVFGNQASVLVGDFLYSRAFQMMVDARRHADHGNHGRRDQHDRRGRSAAAHERARPDTTEQRYLEVIYRKTAKLFEAGAQIAAILAERDRRRSSGAGARTARHLGTAFQLVDDVLDYRADRAELGKNLGDDLAEGKPTLPLIHAMAHASPDDATLLRSSGRNGRAAGLASVSRRIIESAGGLEYTARLARREARSRDRGPGRDSRFGVSDGRLARSRTSRSTRTH